VVAGEALRDRILELVGVPATVGIGRTRTLAKLVSDTAKPFGALTLLDRRDEQGLLSIVPVTEVAGIKGRRAARMAPYGIQTCLDLARADGGFIKKLLTATGHDLWLELNGVPAQPIHTRRVPHKALSRGGSFGGSTADPLELYAWLVRNTERLIEELEYHGVTAGRLHLRLGYKDAPHGVGVASPEVPTDRFDLLLDAGRFALRQAYRPGAAAERMHLIAQPLVPRALAARSLFVPPGDRAEAVAALKREVNAKVGRWAVRSGAILPLTRIYNDPSNTYVSVRRTPRHRE
jgi:hypothetical protein